MYNSNSMLYSIRDTRNVAQIKDDMAHARTLGEWLSIVVKMIGMPKHERYEVVEYDKKTGNPSICDWVEGDSIETITVYNHSSFIRSHSIPQEIKGDLKVIQDDDDPHYFAVDGVSYQIQSMKSIDQDERTVRAGVIIKKASIKHIDIV